MLLQGVLGFRVYSIPPRIKSLSKPRFWQTFRIGMVQSAGFAKVFFGNSYYQNVGFAKAFFGNPYQNADFDMVFSGSPY